MRRTILAALLLAIALPSIGGAVASDLAVTVDTTASEVLAASSGRGYRNVLIANQSATATISCRSDEVTPAIAGSGSFDIGPKYDRLWSSSNVTWNGPFTCISDTTGTPVTVEAE